MVAPEISALLACGAAPAEVVGRISDAIATQTNWQRLMDLADAHGMLPLLSGTVRSAPNISVPSDIAIEIRERTAAKTLRTLGMAGELARIMGKFESAGIRSITFKGPTLAHVAYGNLALRDSTDLDIYVPRQELKAALDILVGDGYRKKSHGFQTSLAGACEVALRRQDRDCEIDLHWEFSPPYFLPFNAARASSRSVMVRTSGLSARTLCPEDLLIYLCIHAARECWGVRSVCDVATLTRNCIIDWDDVLHEASRAHCWRAVAVGLKLAVDLMLAPVPQNVWHKVEQDCAVAAIATHFAANITNDITNYAGAPGGAALHLRMMESTLFKVRYLWRRAFQPNHLDADFIRLPKPLAAAYYIVRPLRVACAALGHLSDS